uniref:Sulfurtransferase n=1 Tax=Kryptolebias marmoratus TaxID=37003 RepID=A0A3Q3BBI2_KRYMA
TTPPHLCALVSGQWLADAIRDNLVGPKLAVLDCSWYLPKAKRNTRDEFAQKHIPGASFFDIDECCDKSSKADHMLPSPGFFSQFVGDLGIGNDTHVVADGRPVSSEHKKPERREFRATLNASWVKSYEDVLDNIKTKKVQVVDTRSAGRFKGTDPEPRDDILPGHFPGAINMPYTKFLDSSGKHLGTEALAQLFKDAGVDLERPLWASCGSGVTACHIILAAERLGHPGVPLYDGSWCEWFQRAEQENIISEWGKNKE